MMFDQLLEFFRRPPQAAPAFPSPQANNVQNHAIEAGLFHLALVILIAAAVLNLTERLLQAWLVPNTAARQAALEVEIADLKHRARELNTPDTFSQCAKLERRALALEKELTRVKELDALAKSNYLLRLPSTFRGVAVAGLFILSFQHPIISTLRSSDVWPMGKWLRFGSGADSTVSGIVALLPYAYICHRVTRSLLY